MMMIISGDYTLRVIYSILLDTLQHFDYLFLFNGLGLFPKRRNIFIFMFTTLRYFAIFFVLAYSI